MLIHSIPWSTFLHRIPSPSKMYIPHKSLKNMNDAIPVAKQMTKKDTY